MVLALQLDVDAILPDFEVYLQQMLTATFTLMSLPPGEVINPRPDTDEDTADGAPQLWWSISADGADGFGPAAWNVILNVSLIADGMDAAKRATRRMHQGIVSWGLDPNFTRLDVDGQTIVCSSVDVSALPTRLPAAEIEGRTLVQYSGAYALVLRAL